MCTRLPIGSFETENNLSATRGGQAHKTVSRRKFLGVCNEVTAFDDQTRDFAITRCATYQATIDNSIAVFKRPTNFANRNGALDGGIVVCNLSNSAARQSIGSEACEFNFSLGGLTERIMIVSRASFQSAFGFEANAFADSLTAK